MTCRKWLTLPQSAPIAFNSRPCNAPPAAPFTNCLPRDYSRGDKLGSGGRIRRRSTLPADEVACALTRRDRFPSFPYPLQVHRHSAERDPARTHGPRAHPSNCTRSVQNFWFPIVCFEAGASKSVGRPDTRCTGWRPAAAAWLAFTHFGREATCEC